MLKIQRLNRPNKRSGYALKPGDTTEVRGLTIVNRSSATVYVDKFTPWHKRKRK